MKPKVCVIGAGISGVSTAFHIAQQNPNVEVTIVSEKFSPDTPADGATGFWFPFLPGDTPEHLVYRWGKATWDHLTELVRDGKGGDLGIEMLHAYHLFDTFQKDPIWKDDVLGFRQVSTEEIKKVFPPNIGLPYGWAYTSFVMECDKYIPWLMQRFRHHGGKLQRRRIQSIGELVEDYDIVVNCSGVNAYHLVNDKDVTPVRGQLIKVRAPWLKVMVAAITKDSVTHMTPKSDYVILGGSKDYGRWDTAIDSEERAAIFERNCKLVPSLRKATIINDWADLRPGRASIRVEKEIMKFGPRRIPVVHNYGHGGSGITLHWGCAQDAAGLVHQCLKKDTKDIISSKL